MSQWRRFHTEVPAKWILGGEHSVLRGGTAIALPHPELKLTLSFEPQSISELRIFPSESAPVIRELIQSVVDRLGEDGKSFVMPEGELRLESSIPSGAGLGASAAISVAFARWFAEPLQLEGEMLYEFAMDFEYRLHGRRSGVDVAAALLGKPISFGEEKGYRAIGIKKLPRFTLHDTGLRARMSECVYRIQALREENPHLGMEIDEKMGHSVRSSMEGLVHFDQGMRGAGLQKIAAGMTLAQECFYSWMLVPGDAHRIEETLLAQGALAVKMTGAGGGGYVVALWKD